VTVLRGIAACACAVAVTVADVAADRSAAESRGDDGLLVVRERVVNTTGAYEEGAISYLKVKRISDGEVVVRRSYRGDPIRLDERLAADRYKLISFVQPCSGDCSNLDPPTDRCAARVRIPRVGSVRAKIITNDGSPCRAKLSPIPTLTSHGVTIRPSLIGTCEVPAPGEPPCGYPDVFAPTRPLPVHPGGGVVLRTDDAASAVRVYLCGRERHAEQRSPRRWVVRVPRPLPHADDRCDYNDMTVDFKRGRFAGYQAAYTFRGRLHQH
jgi:hypothetical protein